MSRALKELSKLYPNKLVIDLNKYPTLRMQLYEERKAAGFKDLKDYLMEYGFLYSSNARIIEDEEIVKIELEKYYPNKIVTRLCDNNNLNKLIRKVSNYYGSSIGEYLEGIGYQFKKNTGLSSSLDPVAVNRLYTDFDLTYQEIGDYVGVTRQRVKQIVERGGNGDSWEVDEIPDDISLIFESMIINHSFETYTDEMNYLIKNNNKGEGVLIWYNNDQIECIFNEKIPNRLYNLMVYHSMNKFKKEDYDFLSGCTIVQKLRKNYIINYTEENKNKFEKARRIHKLSKEEYCQFLGYEGCLDSRETKTDEKLIDFLEENLIDGEVYISSDPKNQWFRRYAAQTGLGVEGLINYFGYIQAPQGKYGYDKRKDKLDLKHREELKEYIYQEPNIVLLPSDSELYKNIYYASKRRGLDFDEYINELGFSRINTNINRIMREPRSEIAKKHDIQTLNQDINRIKFSIGESEKFSIKTIEQRKRNRTLVDRLKNIYDNKCQLCCENEAFEIIKKDDSHYVEVHHIIPLSEELDIYSDEITEVIDGIPEDECLDVLENMIVLCPNHHRYLHYHQGGNFRLKKKDGELCLENPQGKFVKIQTNYHLNI